MRLACLVKVKHRGWGGEMPVAFFNHLPNLYCLTFLDAQDDALLLLLLSGSVVDTEKPDDSCAGSELDVDVEEFRNSRV